MIIEEIDNILRCRFGSSLTGMVCDKIQDRLEQQVDASLAKHPDLIIEFDLKESRLVTSAFLRLCVRYFKLVGSKRFRLLNLDEHARSVFACSGLIEIMDYRETGQKFDLSG